MGLFYLIIWLVPRLIFLALVVGLAAWFGATGKRRPWGLACAVLALLAASQWQGVTLDYTLGLVLPSLLIAGGMACVWRLMNGRGPRIVLSVAALLCAAAFGTLAVIPQTLTANLAIDTLTEGETLQFDVDVGPWPALGPTSIMFDERWPRSDADYFTEAETGRLMLPEDRDVFGTTRMDAWNALETGQFTAEIWIEQGFWQQMTSPRGILVSAALPLTVTDADGEIGKRAAIPTLQSAIRNAFGTRYLPLLAYGDWTFGALTEQSGLWCMTGRLQSVLSATGSACIDPGGINGRSSGYRIADAIDVTISDLAADHQDIVIRVRASMPVALELYRAEHPDRADWPSIYLTGGNGHDSSWVRLDDATRDWEVYLALDPGGGALEGVSYRLTPQGDIVLEPRPH